VVQPWAGSQRPLGLPRNAATARAYSGINILILWCAVAERGFTGQNWLTFRQALKIGAHVRKGEKGTTVVYADRFVPYRERTRAAETGDEPEAIPFLKRFTVFNIDNARIFRRTSPRRRRPSTTTSSCCVPASFRIIGARWTSGAALHPAPSCRRRFYPGAAAVGLLRAGQLAPHRLS
jgi:hypothetical protein